MVDSYQKSVHEGILYGVENGGDGGSGGSGFLKGRWPRQETLTLLEIRTRLHPMFKQPDAQKAPLWDEVSRIMAEEHDYQRSGKKCKEKLDNLYKYYKKTKGMNKGRKDGRNYRFFKQLEALYGENSTNTTIHQAQENQEAIQTDHKLISSEEDSDEEEGSESDEINEEYDWNLEIRDLIEMQMRKLMEVQESWFEKMLHAIQSMEQRKASREEAWRKQELAQSERDERVWAREKAWIEARNAEIINAVEKIICERRASNEEESTCIETCDDHEDEIANLIRLQS